MCLPLCLLVALFIYRSCPQKDTTRTATMVSSAHLKVRLGINIPQRPQGSKGHVLANIRITLWWLRYVV